MGHSYIHVTGRIIEGGREPDIHGGRGAGVMFTTRGREERVGRPPRRRSLVNLEWHPTF